MSVGSHQQATCSPCGHASVDLYPAGGDLFSKYSYKLQPRHASCRDPGPHRKGYMKPRRTVRDEVPVTRRGKREAGSDPLLRLLTELQSIDSMCIIAGLWAGMPGRRGVTLPEASNNAYPPGVFMPSSNFRTPLRLLGLETSLRHDSSTPGPTHSIEVLVSQPCAKVQHKKSLLNPSHKTLLPK